MLRGESAAPSTGPISDSSRESKVATMFPNDEGDAGGVMESRVSPPAEE